MSKNKIIAKGCPKCEQQVPVACRHSFLSATRIKRSPSPVDDICRRTQGMRREKPHYYDASDYHKQVKRIKLCKNKYEDAEKKDSEKSKRRKIIKEEDEEDNFVTELTPEIQLVCTVALAEINRKLQLVTWKPK